MRSYYNRSTPNQLRGVFTRPTAGLNEYNSSINITDNHFSDLLDGTPYRDDSVVFDVEQTLSAGVYHNDADTTGIILDVTAIQSSSDYCALVYNKSLYSWDIRHFTNGSVVSYPILNSTLPKSAIVQHGNFDTGFVSPWTSTNAGTPTVTVAGCKFTASAQNGGLSFAVPVVAGRKYYVGGAYDNVAASKILFSRGLTWDGGSEFNIITTLATGVIYPDMIYTPTHSGTMNVKIYDSRASGWTEVSAFYINVLDVTDQTGADADVLDKYLNLGFSPYIESVDVYSYSSCNYSTAANNYVAFCCSYSPYIYTFDYINLAVDSINLPFYPKKMVTHANRIFIIDVTNIFWWSRAGDIYSWYSLEYDDNYLMASANMSLTPYTLAAQPDVPRPITAKVTTVSTADTLGTLTIVGLGVLGQTQTETLIPIANARVQTLLSYSSITSITSIGWVIGDTADTIEFGIAPVSSGYVQSDNGYWTIEREKVLTDLCVLSGNLYIFAPDNIYVFRGYSPDTFTLSQSVVDIGIGNFNGLRKWLTTINNLAYFYTKGDVYEFNGYDYPRLITHPVEVNGQSSNGIFSGIATLNESYSLASDNDKLYVYDSTITLFDTNYYYEFNTKARSWFKKSGFSKLNSVYSTTAFRVFYVTKSNTDGIVAFISVDSAVGSFDMHIELGHKGLYNPYLITKAYNSTPSELGTLTSIILQMKGVSTAKADVVLSYSTLASGGTFTEFKRFVGYDFNDDIQSVDIPVPTSAIASTHHYRIKIEFDGYVELYNIERRFRVRGMSR